MYAIASGSLHTQLWVVSHYNTVYLVKKTDIETFMHCTNIIQSSYNASHPEARKLVCMHNTISIGLSRDDSVASSTSWCCGPKSYLYALIYQTISWAFAFFPGAEVSLGLLDHTVIIQMTSSNPPDTSPRNCHAHPSPGKQEGGE